MLRYVLRRLAVLPLVLFGVTVIVFLTLALIPGDPAVTILGPYATPAKVARLRTNSPSTGRWSSSTARGSATWSRATSAAPTASTGR